jgi:CubicO group peptidase (beta-lactamase class C family)
MIIMLSKNSFYSLAIVLALCCFIGASVHSQEQAVDAQTKGQLKVIMTHLLDTIYVLPEIGKQLSKQLQAKFDSGAYKDAATPTQLAALLTRDLRELSKDKHLSLRYDPAASERDTILTAAEWETRRPSMFPRESRPQSAQPQSGNPGPSSRMANQLQQANYHFREAKVLNGNIGYLDMGGFAPGQSARDAATKAMATLAASEAMIIDLRRCPGGSAEMVNYLASYFFDKEPRVLMNRYIRPTGETIQSKTIADIPGKRMLDTELYLLVGHETASACESFPYTLQQYGRAKVVGERTAGAGYNNVIIPLGKGYSFSVSFGRPAHPRSGKGWEGEGVKPDIATDADNALETAQREALQKLISRTTDEKRKHELTSALQDVTRGRDIANPVTSIVDLQGYAGKYGNKEISVRDGGLYYQRTGGRGGRLQATGKDKFALNTDAQIVFIRDEKSAVKEMVIEWVGRDQEQLKREAPSETSTSSQPESALPKLNANDDAALGKELDKYLEQATANDAFSGAVLIARNGQPVFKKAYGMSNKSNSTLNNVETKFDLGSMNKMFTAVAVAQLAERGKLSFNDTVGKLLPDYPNKAVADKVTVHHLLTHTSGMGSYFNEKFMANLNNMKTVSDYLPLFVNDPLAFEPGAKWQYSNSGFTVLGLIIEKVSGQSYYDYLKQHISKPAGMMSTDSYERDKEVPNMAIGYTKAGENGRLDPSAARRPNTPMRPFKGSPAGGGYSTVEDLLRFSIALHDHKLLSQKYTEIITTGKVETGAPGRKYAYGFGDDMSNGRHIVGHNGGGPGIGANFDMLPELGYTTVILGNYDPPALMPVVKKIRELIAPAPPSASSTGTPTQAPPSQALAQTVPGSQAEQEVRKLEREWLDAYEQHDVGAMNRILADDFTLSHSGTVQTKADVLKMIGLPRPAGAPSFKFSTEDVQARVNGDTVILSGRVVQKGERNGQPMMMQSRYEDTYMKRQGRWQVVSSKLTRLPAE